MREILFRGQRVDNGEWVYGHYIENSIDSPCIIDYDANQFEIKKESVGQFTGLLDKNGNKILEGDLCRFKWNPILNEPSDLFTFELPVVYYKIWGCWCFHLKTNKMNEPQKELFTDYSIEEKYVAIGSPIEYAENPSDGVEIIGNIHEDGNK